MIQWILELKSLVDNWGPLGEGYGLHSRYVTVYLYLGDVFMHQENVLIWVGNTDTC